MKLSSCERFTPLPDEAPEEFGNAVLSLNVHFTPLLEEAPEGIGVEVELDVSVWGSGESVSHPHLK